MKSSQKLDYSRFAEALAERQLVDRATLDHVVQQCAATGALMTDILVREGLLSDWEVSRVSCELYGLSYLPVASYPPVDGILEGLDPDYLRQYGLVPLDRFGSLLTVTMPGLVPSEILEGLACGDGVHVLPAVGSVTGNREWLETNLPPSTMGSLDDVGASLPSSDMGSDWAELFDAGEEAVQNDLRQRD